MLKHKTMSTVTDNTNALKGLFQQLSSSNSTQPINASQALQIVNALKLVSDDTASTYAIGSLPNNDPNVTVNATKGVINVAAGIVNGDHINAGAWFDFTLTNSYITTTSMIFFSVQQTVDPDNNGCAYINAGAPSAGSALVRINNVASEANEYPISTAFKINFIVVNV